MDLNIKNRLSAAGWPTRAGSDIPPPPTFPPPPSDTEAKFYYAGLPSGPKLVARTSNTQWKQPTGPEAYRVIKELRPVGRHALVDIWEGRLSLRIIHDLERVMKVEWTSIDVVRIGSAKVASSPVILWIGVVPESLSSDRGFLVAFRCRQCLRQHGITDVEVEIRESIITRSVGPRLLTPELSSDPTADIREPLTTTLGLSICAKATPQFEGTGGFFITDARDRKRLLLVTARHVLFPYPNSNELYRWIGGNQHRHYVALLGDAGFTKCRTSILTKIENNTATIGRLEQRIAAVGGINTPGAIRERRRAQFDLDDAREAEPVLQDFYETVSTNWDTLEKRTLGRVIFSPPINGGIGNGEHTEDWAVIEIDSSKIDGSNFNGNVIDLGTDISPEDFTRMMRPDPRNPSSSDFEYPADRLLRLRGTISDEEMRHPTTFDQYDEPCLVVLKRGHATGLTVGRANNIRSCVRNYFGDNNTQTSWEWAIFPRGNSGAFSGKGDSGSVIVDGRGRIGGLLTGGAGLTPLIDITYATPITFLLERMAQHGLYDPQSNPDLAA